MTLGKKSMSFSSQNWRKGLSWLCAQGASSWLRTETRPMQGGAGHDVLYVDNSGNGEYLVGGNVLHSKAPWVFNTADQATINDSQKVAGIQAGTPASVGSYGVKVQVNYRALLSQAIAIDDKADFKANQQDINKAIKQAIQGDAVLSQLLEVIDGPGGTLGILCKTDAQLDAASLDLKFIAPGQDEPSPKVVADFIAHNPSAGMQDAAGLLKHIENHVTSAQVNGSLHHDSYPQTFMLPSDNRFPIDGQNSNVVGDHIINGSTGNNVIVLGTAWHPSGQLLGSNDTVKYTTAFDHDTTVNFDAGPLSGADKLDFTPPSTATTVNKTEITAPTASVVDHVTDGHIRLVHKHVQDGTTPATTDNDSAQDVQQLFTDAATGTAARQIYIAVDSQTGTGEVYQVVDSAGTNNQWLECDPARPHHPGQPPLGQHTLQLGRFDARELCLIVDWMTNHLLLPRFALKVCSRT